MQGVLAENNALQNAAKRLGLSDVIVGMMPVSRSTKIMMSTVSLNNWKSKRLKVANAWTISGEVEQKTSR